MMEDRHFTHWTEHNRARLIEGVRVVSIAAAARRCGIGERTVHRWMARGRDAAKAFMDGEEIDETEREYMRWAADMDVAIGEAEFNAAGTVLLASKDQWGDVPIPDGKGGMTTVRKLIKAGDARWAAWYLERRWGKRWGKQHLEITGEDGGPIKLAEIAERMIEDSKHADEVEGIDGGGSLDIDPS